jgi:hypothetical protein
MAQHKLGHDREAAIWLRKADEWTDGALGDREQPPLWDRTLTRELLRSEAHLVVASSPSEIR